MTESCDVNADEDSVGNQESAKERKTKSSKSKSKRWRWKAEMSDSLVTCLAEIKSKYEFKGKDFESDLVALYKEAREAMATLYSEEHFGPVQLIEDNDDISQKEYKQLLTEQKKLIKMGYQRIREKVKEVRQDYRKAVTSGRRSGSGKLICENWDTLKTLWGGSPATGCIVNPLTSLEQLENESFEPELSEEEDLDKDSSIDDESPNGSCSGQKRKAEEPNVQRFVDNKRKQLEKNLSAHQRDQVFLKVAQDELKIKEAMVKNLTEATVQSNKAIEKMSESMASVGKAIGDGLALLAKALAPPAPVVSPVPVIPMFNPYNNYNAPHSTPYNSNNNINLPFFRNNLASPDEEEERQYQSL